MDIEVRQRGRPRRPEGPESHVIHIRLGAEAFGWLNAEWRRRGVPSRAEAVRAILNEARASK